MSWLLPILGFLGHFVVSLAASFQNAAVRWVLGYKVLSATGGSCLLPGAEVGLLQALGFFTLSVFMFGPLMRARKSQRGPCPLRACL